MNYKVLFCSILVVLLFYNYSLAEDITPKPYKKHKITVVSDNDAYLLPLSDKYYTAGQRIGYTSREWDFHNEDNSSKGAWLHKISLHPENNVTSFNISINQEIYTPENKSVNIPENDYLYGGSLYLTFGVNQRRDTSLERLQLQLGVVGKYSFAEDVQNGIHNSVNKEHNSPLPWINQVGDEVLINFLYSYTARLRLINSNIISMYLLPTAMVSLGNGATYLDVNTRLQIGYNLDTSFGVHKITYGMDSIGVTSDDFMIYLYGGVGSRLMARNIFVQGNTFQEPYRHKIYPFVLYLEAGFSIGYNGVELSYGITHKTREYKFQPKEHTYATIYINFAI